MNDESSSDSASFLEKDYSELLSDISLLKPFDFEPECAGREEILYENSVDPSALYKSQDARRIRNNEWCNCGGCRTIETVSESLCFCDTNEIPDSFFEGILLPPMIILSRLFKLPKVMKIQYIFSMHNFKMTLNSSFPLLFNYLILYVESLIRDVKA